MLCMLSKAVEFEVTAVLRGRGAQEWADGADPPHPERHDEGEGAHCADGHLLTGPSATHPGSYTPLLP